MNGIDVYQQFRRNMIAIIHLNIIFLDTSLNDGLGIRRCNDMELINLLTLLSLAFH